MLEEVDIEEWACESGSAPLPPANGYKISMWSGAGFNEKRRIEDSTPTPEQVLEKFGRRPAENYILLSLDKHGISELPLGSPIDISDRRTEKFFAFETDRTYKAKLNGDRFPWGAESISVDMLRRIGHIPKNHHLVLERADEPDKVLAEDDSVSLDDPGLEKIYSRKRKTVTIIVEGTPHEWPKGKITFAQLVALEVPEYTEDSQITYSVKYKKGHGAKPEGFLSPGASVKVKEGMIFNVSETGQS